MVVAAGFSLLKHYWQHSSDVDDSKFDDQHTTFPAFLGGSLLGLVSSIVVIAFYMKYSVLRTHTNTLLFWRTVCDGGLAMLFLSYALTALSMGGPGKWEDMMSDKDSQQRMLLAGLFQFFTISSETWFFCNSRDLMLTLTDPFTSDKANLRNYHAFSWSLSLIMSSFMATPSVWGEWYVGGCDVDHYPVFYLNNEKTSYFTDQTWWHILLFYGPVLSIYVYALMVFTKTFMQFKQSKGHIASTLSARLHILAANAVNIIVYLGYWTIFAIAYSTTYVIVNLTAKNSTAYYFFYWLSLFAAPCKGFCDLLVFVITNDLSSERLQGSGPSVSGGYADANHLEGNPLDDDAAANTADGVLPQSNKALRDEVLFFVTTGIRQATELSAGERDSAGGGGGRHRRHGGGGGGGGGGRVGGYGGGSTLRPGSIGGGDSIASASRREILIDANVIRRSSLAGGGRSTLDDNGGGGGPGHGGGGGSGAGEESDITLRSFLDQLMMLLVGSKQEREEVRHRLSFNTGPIFQSDNEQALAAEEEQRRHPELSARSHGADTAAATAAAAAATNRGLSPPASPSPSPPSSSVLLPPPATPSGSSSYESTFTDGGDGDDRASGMDGTVGGVMTTPRANSSDLGAGASSMGSRSSLDSSALRPRLSRQSSPSAASASTSAFSAENNYRRHGSAGSASGGDRGSGGGGGGGSGGGSGSSGDGPNLRVLQQGRVFAQQGRNDDVVFVDYCPEVFADVRRHFGIDHSVYIAEWTTAAKVKLNEGGASSAFFFYSGGERFIAKSCTRTEMNVLCRIAAEYRGYLQQNPRSFLLRILGAHCFKTYNTDFFFFVMENIFKIDDDVVGGAGEAPTPPLASPASPDDALVSDLESAPSAGGSSARGLCVPCAPGTVAATAAAAAADAAAAAAAAAAATAAAAGSTGSYSASLSFPTPPPPSLPPPPPAPAGNSSVSSVLQERYDIKGSWVSRNCSMPKNGQKVTCRYCNQVYRFRRRDVGNSANSPSPSQRRHTSTFTRATEQFRRRSNGGLGSSGLLGGFSSGSGRRGGSSGLGGSGSGSDGSFVGAFVNTIMASYAGDEEDPTQLCPERLDRKHVPNLVLKDNDLNYRLNLDPAEAEATCDQLSRDAHFLETQALMDYSLLIGVHIEKHRIVDDFGVTSRYPSGGDPEDSAGSSSSSSHGGFPSASSASSSAMMLMDSRHQGLSTNDMGALQSRMCRRQAVCIEGPTVFYLGVVDILQEWTWQKKLERLFKVMFQSAEPDGLSAVPPRQYCNRFQFKMRDILGIGFDVLSEAQWPMSP